MFQFVARFHFMPTVFRLVYVCFNYYSTSRYLVQIKNRFKIGHETTVQLNRIPLLLSMYNDFTCRHYAPHKKNVNREKKNISDAFAADESRGDFLGGKRQAFRSEEHTSEL